MNQLIKITTIKTSHFIMLFVTRLPLDTKLQAAAPLGSTQSVKFLSGLITTSVATGSRKK